MPHLSSKGKPNNKEHLTRKYQLNFENPHKKHLNILHLKGREIVIWFCTTVPAGTKLNLKQIWFHL